eukprot:gene7447-7657_t
MLAAALLPWPVLRGLVEVAVAAAKQSLLSKDSVAAWINSGAAIEEQHQQQADGIAIQQALQQHETPGSGVTVTVEGQQVEALEALIKRLLAENAPANVSN